MMCILRIWEKIKVNDTVIYNNEKYIVLEIFDDDRTKCATLKNLQTGEICRTQLYSCRIEEN